jgi:hypothetical protein
MEPTTIKSTKELAAFIRRHCRPLPRKGRTHEQKEYWTLGHFLKLAHASRSVHLPISIRKSEAPDFLLGLGNSGIGLEITEATTSEYQHWLSRIDELDGAHMFSRAGWSGDGVERAAAGLILAAAQAKSDKYAKRVCNPPDLGCYLSYELPALDEVKTFALATDAIRQARDTGSLAHVGRVHVIDPDWVMFDIGGVEGRLLRK